MTDFIHQRILSTLKELTEKAQKADEILHALNKENATKFSAIFPKKSLFSVNTTFFLPYIEEVDKNLADLPDVSAPKFQDLLIPLMKKIELLHQVLACFHEIKDDQ